MRGDAGTLQEGPDAIHGLGGPVGPNTSTTGTIPSRLAHQADQPGAHDHEQTVGPVRAAMIAQSGLNERSSSGMSLTSSHLCGN